MSHIFTIGALGKRYIFDTSQAGDITSFHEETAQMDMLNMNKRSSRGLGLATMMMTGVSALLLIAGSAQAISVDLSSYEGGDAEFTVGDQTISITENRGKTSTEISISFDGAELAVNTISVAVRPGRGVLASADDASATVVRKSFRDDEVLDLAVNSVSGGATLTSEGWQSFTLAAIDIDLPVPAEPVTAVPEPGAALLFGAGIVLAGRRRL